MHLQLKETEITTFKFTFDNFVKFLDPIFVSVLVPFAYFQNITTIICFLIGYPIAYMIAKCKPQTQTMLILLITIPTWINLLMRTYSWMSILSNNGLINNFWVYLGLNQYNFYIRILQLLLGWCITFCLL